MKLLQHHLLTLHTPSRCIKCMWGVVVLGLVLVGLAVTQGYFDSSLHSLADGFAPSA